MKKFLATINANKKQIIIRTVIVAGAVVGVTLASGLIKIAPSEKAVEITTKAAGAVKKAAE